MLCWFIKRTTGCWYLGNGYLGIRVYMYPPTQCLLNSPFASHEEETAAALPARGLSSNGTSGSSSAVYPAPAVPTTKSIIICRQQRLYNQLNTFKKHLYYQQMTIPCQCQLPYSLSCRPPCQLPCSPSRRPPHRATKVSIVWSTMLARQEFPKGTMVFSRSFMNRWSFVNTTREMAALTNTHSPRQDPSHT